MSMWRCPGEIERALWAAARAGLPASALREEALERAVIARSRRYTSDRDPPETSAGGAAGGAHDDAIFDASPEEDLAARALFFTVADAAKIQVPLAELRLRGLLPPTRPLRIVDVGAGAGAMTLGAIAALEPHSLEIRAFDRDRRALELLRAASAELPGAWRERVDIGVATTDVRHLELDASSVDIAFAGSLLNELRADEALSLVRELLGSLCESGALIIIEPALRESSRALHELRDCVIGEGLANVFAPCVRRAAPCPALELERDWCHEDRPTSLPERAARMARRTGLRRHGLKFSYLVLRRGDEGLVDAPPDGERAVRVVSQPRKLKGRRECYGCGDDGRSLVRLLKRNRSPSNRSFDRARRGDVLLMTGDNEIAAADVVTRVAPAEEG